MKPLHRLGEPYANVTSIRPEHALDQELMRAGEAIAEGAPPLSSAQVDLIVATLRSRHR